MTGTWDARRRRRSTTSSRRTRTTAFCCCCVNITGFGWSCCCRCCFHAIATLSVR
ncbi:hypothetical protein B0O80DRAFT_471827 [Mortierella sp. GBAus27b]|nr:hypothetical protein B0O80DRAFT_471827 [Mortierella sp. GBAus27b]